MQFSKEWKELDKEDGELLCTNIEIIFCKLLAIMSYEIATVLVALLSSCHG